MGFDSDEDDAWDAEQARLAEIILGSTAHLLADIGDEESQRASLLLEDVRLLSVLDEPRGLLIDDPWGAGRVYGQEPVAYLDVDAWMVDRFTDTVRATMLPIMRQVSGRLLPKPVEHVETRLAMPPIDPETWRQTLRARTSEDLTNQARNERHEPVSPVRDGLAFSNDHEARVYDALVELQSAVKPDDNFAIVPLPGVRIAGGHTWTPDFMVSGRGRTMIIEVDGPHHRKPDRRAQDDMRDLQWRRCRIEVRRLPVETTDPENKTELKAWLTEELGRVLGFRE